MKKFALGFTLLAALGAAVAAQGGPFSGNAEVYLQLTPATPAINSTFEVDLYVDLTGITGSGSTPAALGGFAIPVAFDNSRLTLISVEAGTSGAFTAGDLVFTDLPRANARGFVTVVNTQTASGTPTGIVHVATLTFQTGPQGGRVHFNVNSARTIHEGSLASTYTAANGGPDEIPYDDETALATIATGGVSYSIYYPVFISGDADFMGVTVVNEGVATENLNFRAYNPAGQLITQAGMTNPNVSDNPLAPLQQYVRMSHNLFGSSGALDIEHGWIEVTANEHNLSGFFLIGHIEGADITQMDGAEVGHQVASRVIFPVLGKDAARDTDLYAINPGTTAAAGNLLMKDNLGNTVQTIPVNIPAHGVYEGTFTANTLDRYFDLTLTSGEVFGFQLFGNANALAGLNAQAAADTTANILYDAHFASGNYGIRYFTEINVINASAQVANLTLHLINDAGSEIVTPVARTLNPGAQLRVMGHTLFGLPDPLTAADGVSGSVMIESDQGVVGSITFGDAQNGLFLASLPLLSTSAAKREIYLDHVAIGLIGTVNYWTGIALVNPSRTRTASINLQLYDQNGNLTAQTATPVELAPGQRTSRMLPSFFPGFSGNQFGGFVRLTSDVEVFSFMLFGDVSLNFLAAVPVR
ncbi:MAG: hypothetical protein GX414_09545 [Acidobacteria bacterium]|nr:hypothetical protein [Acidobacteriota bacterium]